MDNSATIDKWGFLFVIKLKPSLNSCKNIGQTHIISIQFHIDLGIAVFIKIHWIFNYIIKYKQVRKTKLKIKIDTCENDPTNSYKVL